MIRIILIPIIFLLSLPLFAEDINMQCQYGELQKTYYFKYSDNLLKDKAYQRVNGNWIDYCDGMVSTQNLGWLNLNRKINNYTVKDKTASCTFYGKGKNYFGENTEGNQTWLLDFEIMTAKIGYDENNLDTGKFTKFSWFNEFKCSPF